MILIVFSFIGIGSFDRSIISLLLIIVFALYRFSLCVVVRSSFSFVPPSPSSSMNFSSFSSALYFVFCFVVIFLVWYLIMVFFCVLLVRLICKNRLCLVWNFF